METLQDIICFNLDIHLWTARRQLSPADLGISESEIPPVELASLGSKRVFDPEYLKVFDRLKKESERMLAGNGLRFLGGYAIPAERCKKVKAELERIKTEFMAEKDSLELNYTQVRDKWISDYPKYSEAIRRALVPWETVNRQLNYGYQAFKVIPSATLSDDEMAQDGFSQAVNGLSDQLYAEIAKEAEQAWQKSIVGRDEITRRALSPLKRIIEKMEGLAFLDSAVRPISDHIANVLAAVPKTGSIEGSTLHAIAGLYSLLTDPARIKDLGHRLVREKGGYNDVVQSETAPTIELHNEPDEKDIDEQEVLPAEAADVELAQEPDLLTESGEDQDDYLPPMDDGNTQPNLSSLF